MKFRQEKPREVYSRIGEKTEEVVEKRTSIMGYIMLAIMTILIVIAGETIFSDLSGIPERPSRPSSCVLNNVERIDTLRNTNCSRFSEIDTRFGIDSSYKAILPELNQITAINEDINQNNRNISNLERNNRTNKKDYDLSLQEKMAQENPITNKNGLKNTIVLNEQKISSLKVENGLLESKRSRIKNGITPSITKIKSSHKKALEYYKSKKAWYNFKVFMLQLVFVLPLFLISVFYYLKLKRKNSPQTIILTAVTTAFSFLFLQIALVFLYDILPTEWLMRIFRILLDSPFMRYVIYYGSMFLIIGIFGGVVFFIQKRVFSPKQVARRRLKDKKCPNCSFPIEADHSFCPDCGLQIKEVCSNCGELRVQHLVHCSNCGAKNAEVE